MHQEYQSINKKESCPWMIVYHGGEGGVEYLSYKEYGFIQEDMDANHEFTRLPDDRTINLRGFQRIIRNPNYIDPDRVAMLRKEQNLWEEYQQLKKSGRFNSMQEFIKWKKTQLSREELEEMKSLLNNTAETANGSTNKK